MMVIQEPEGYRGALVYRQEYAYKLVAITVDIACNERSHVISYAYNLPVSENAEHLQGVDMYHFVVTDGIWIQLTIDTSTDSKET